MTRILRLPHRPWLAALAVLLATAVALFAVAQQSPASDENPVVMRLGSDVVRLDELEGRFEIAIRSLAANQGVPLDDQIRAQLAPYLPQFLQQFATERVLLLEADQRNIEAPQDEVDATLERLRANIPEGESFASLLEGAGFQSEEQLRGMIEESLRIDAVVQSIRDDVEVTDEQLRLAYQTRREEFRTPAEVCARHILLETEEDARDVLSELEQGADFATLAQERSTGPSAPQGGDLGCLASGATVAPFDEAAFGAPVGEPVGPVETQFGHHVILVYERHEAGLTPFEDAREDLRRQVVEERVDRIVDSLIATSALHTYPDRLPEPPAPEPAAPEPAAPDSTAPEPEGEDAQQEGEAVPDGEDSGTPDAGDETDTTY